MGIYVLHRPGQRSVTGTGCGSGPIPARGGQNGAMVQTVRLCQLVVFCGLPGVGKTALSRRVADALGATFLRIDTIEAAIAARGACRSTIQLAV